MITDEMKVTLKPTAAQAELITKTLDCCGMLWNRMIADEAKLRAEFGRRFIPTPTKYKREFPQLKEVDSQALSNTHSRLLKRYKDHDYNPHDNPGPQPVERIDAYFTQSKLAKYGFKIRFEDGGVVLPKLGRVPTDLRLELPVGAVIRSAVVERADGEFYCTVKYEYEPMAETAAAAASLEQSA